MGRLVLIRHGQSVWNKKDVFTGWVDVPLSVDGINDAFLAGEKIADIEFDVIFTSVLVRSIETAMLCMSKNKSPKTPVVINLEDKKTNSWARINDQAMASQIIPVYQDWRLNERCYGDLQGQNKTRLGEIYGKEQVRIWRRSFDVAPPNGESLKDTAARSIPFLEEKAIPLVKQGKNVLIVAHGNSLRAIVMHLNHLSAREVQDLEIPTGQPLFYDDL